MRERFCNERRSASVNVFASSVVVMTNGDGSGLIGGRVYRPRGDMAASDCVQTEGNLQIAVRERAVTGIGVDRRCALDRITSLVWQPTAEVSENAYLFYKHNERIDCYAFVYAFFCDFGILVSVSNPICSEKHHVRGTPR